MESKSPSILPTAINRKLHSFNADDAKYRCFFGAIHVETAAFWLAWLSILGCAAGFFEAAYYKEPWVMVSYAISFVFCLFIIWTQDIRKPYLYLPFIIYEGINLVFFVAIVLLLLFAKDETWTKGLKLYVPSWERNQFTTLSAFILAWPYIWYYSIIWRAWRYMKAEQKAIDSVENRTDGARSIP